MTRRSSSSATSTWSRSDCSRSMASPSPRRGTSSCAAAPRVTVSRRSRSPTSCGDPRRRTGSRSNGPASPGGATPGSRCSRESRASASHARSSSSPGTSSGGGTPCETVYCSRRESLSPLHPFGAVMGETPATPLEVAAWAEELVAVRTRAPCRGGRPLGRPEHLGGAQLMARGRRPMLVLITSRPELAEDPNLRPDVAP